MADGTCLLIDLAAGTERQLVPGSSGLVTSIVAEAEMIAVAGFGACAWSRDGRTWTALPVTNPMDATVVVAGTGSGRVACLGSSGLVDHQGTSVAPSPPKGARLAAWRDGTRPQVATSDGATVWVSEDIGPMWEALPTIQDQATIVTLAYGSPGDDVPELLIAATAEEHDRAALWAWREDTWHRLVDGYTQHALVPIATTAGPRGLHAAIGSTVLRPATVGQLVLAAERPPVAGVPIVGLAACIHGERHVLVALAGRGLLVSTSGGLDWTGLEPPVGPPVTAIALRSGHVLELVAAQLGGALSTVELQSA
jgi:hypothetical protein